MPKAKTLINLLGSHKFFIFVLIFFIANALWIALSSAYPMAFDEEFHLGVIRLYADHPSPFWDAQPANSNQFGAIFRDPSYLYHYIFSWPYQILAAITSSEAAQVIVLRLANIGLFAWALVVYHRLIRLMGASKAASNVILLLFVLIPVVPMLAGQINYDNLFILVLGLMFTALLKLVLGLSKTKKIDAKLFLQFVVLGMFGILVKYAFLPLFVAAVGMLAIYIGSAYWGRFKLLLRDLVKGFRAIGKWAKLGFLVAIVVLGVLAFERYGLNYARYGAVVPDCGKVMAAEACKEFGPWGRDYNLAQMKNYQTDPAHRYLLGEWLYGMWYRQFFALGGPTIGYQTKGPLTLPANTYIALAVLGLASVVVALPRLWQKYRHKLLAVVLPSLFYVLVLFSTNFSLYEKTGRPVAINGRYLLPVLLPLAAAAAIALAILLKRWPKARLAIAGLAMLGMLWGGGAQTFIVRNTSDWLWPNQIVRNANQLVKDIESPFVPGANKPRQYMR